MNQPICDRILIIEQDPTVADFIGRQVLQAAGYICHVMSDAAEALENLDQINPDVILIDLKLSGLSAKDFIAALRSRLDRLLPVIVIAHQDTEVEIIQAFRLGAADYLAQPLREAEVISVVDRVLEQIRASREKEQLSQQLQQINLELQKRVSELSTISSIGKAVLSITDQSLLLERILDETIRLTRSDMGWFMLRKENSETFILASQRKLPAVLAAKLYQPWDDGISSLVKISGETLNIHGEALKRFSVSQLGKSFLILPVKAKKHVNGLLILVRKADLAFSGSEQKLLEAIVDYVAVALINSRLFQAVSEQSAVSSEVLERGRQEGKALLKQSLLPSVRELRSRIDDLKSHERQFPPSLRKVLLHLVDEMEKVEQTLEKVGEYHVTKG